jgi:hypothetical protein
LHHAADITFLLRPHANFIRLLDALKVGVRAEIIVSMAVALGGDEVAAEVSVLSSIPALGLHIADNVELRDPLIIRFCVWSQCRNLRWEQ